uniref:Uncharacterized protein n=1 Tax=Gordis virus TaxID=2800918 RepID=A0A894KL98_9MONO|nr:MAG: hypothetical protein [Gordis virus]QRW42743.1 MAG: hypothetical protein [Gordis virus]
MDLVKFDIFSIEDHAVAMLELLPIHKDSFKMKSDHTSKGHLLVCHMDLLVCWYIALALRNRAKCPKIDKVLMEKDFYNTVQVFKKSGVQVEDIIAWTGVSGLVADVLREITLSHHTRITSHAEILNKFHLNRKPIHWPHLDDEDLVFSWAATRLDNFGLIHDDSDGCKSDGAEMGTEEMGLSAVLVEISSTLRSEGDPNLVENLEHCDIVGSGKEEDFKVNVHELLEELTACRVTIENQSHDITTLEKHLARANSELKSAAARYEGISRSLQTSQAEKRASNEKVAVSQSHFQNCPLANLRTESECSKVGRDLDEYVDLYNAALGDPSYHGPLRLLSPDLLLAGIISSNQSPPRDSSRPDRIDAFLTQAHNLICQRLVEDGNYDAQILSQKNFSLNDLKQVLDSDPKDPESLVLHIKSMSKKVDVLMDIVKSRNIDRLPIEKPFGSLSVLPDPSPNPAKLASAPLQPSHTFKQDPMPKPSMTRAEYEAKEAEDAMSRLLSMSGF